MLKKKFISYRINVINQRKCLTNDIVCINIIHFENINMLFILIFKLQLSINGYK